MEQSKKECALLEIFHYVSDCLISSLRDKAASGWLKPIVVSPLCSCRSVFYPYNQDLMRPSKACIPQASLPMLKYQSPN